jgi:uncharacterized membrane protein
MSKLFDTLFGWFLDVVSFFQNMSTNRHDDPLVAEHKALQRNVVRSFVWMFAMLGAFWAAGAFVQALGGVFAGGAFDGWRSTLETAVLVALAGAVAYMVYCSYSLWRFERHGGSD